MDWITAMWSSLTEHFALKGIGGCFLTTISVLVGDNFVLLQALFILVIVDFITGIIKSVKENQKIRSRRLLSTIKKFTLYVLFLIATFQMTRISSLFDWLHIFAAAFLAITELLSIIENLACAGIVIPKWVVKKLHTYLETGSFSGSDDNTST